MVKKILIKLIKIIVLLYVSLNFIIGVLLGYFPSTYSLLVAIISFIVPLFDFSTKIFIKRLPVVFYKIKWLIGIVYMGIGISSLLSVFRGDQNYLFPEASNFIAIIVLLIPTLLIIFGYLFATTPYELKIDQPEK